MHAKFMLNWYDIITHLPLPAGPDGLVPDTFGFSQADLRRSHPPSPSPPANSVMVVNLRPPRHEVQQPRRHQTAGGLRPALEELVRGGGACGGGGCRGGASGGGRSRDRARGPTDPNTPLSGSGGGDAHAWRRRHEGKTAQDSKTNTPTRCDAAT